MITKRTVEPGDRYRFDFDECHFKKGWAQCDTGQDASYFGAWANPITLETTCYCEGDVTRSKCESEAEFVEKIRQWHEWNMANGWGFAIDGMCDERIIGEFRRLGLDDLLH